MDGGGGRGAKGPALKIGVPPRGAKGNRPKPMPLPLPKAQPLPLPPGVTAEISGNVKKGPAVFTPREDVAVEDLERVMPPLGFGSGGRVYKVIHKRTGKVGGISFLILERNALTGSRFF